MIQSIDLHRQLSEGLSELYDIQEAENLALWLMEEYLELSRREIFDSRPVHRIPEALWQAWEELKTGKPIQYVLGKAPFYGRTFLVDSNTLIPRNETEELVHLIIKENKEAGLKILDVGTGSGCIPISLALEMRDAEVFGLDISLKALEVAEKNAAELHAKVLFFQQDILADLPAVNDLDILVSNPPYIPDQQKSEMHSNVLDFEPGLALFVPDQDPLLFYRNIAEKGKKMLKPLGKLYFEIHEDFGKEVVSLLKEKGYSEIRLLKDLNGKNRMVVARI